MSRSKNDNDFHLTILRKDVINCNNCGYPNIFTYQPLASKDAFMDYIQLSCENCGSCLVNKITILGDNIYRIEYKKGKVETHNFNWNNTRKKVE